MEITAAYSLIAGGCGLAGSAMGYVGGYLGFRAEIAGLKESVRTLKDKELQNIKDNVIWRTECDKCEKLQESRYNQVDDKIDVLREESAARHLEVMQRLEKLTK